MLSMTIEPVRCKAATFQWMSNRAPGFGRENRKGHSTLKNSAIPIQGNMNWTPYSKAVIRHFSSLPDDLESHARASWIAHTCMPPEEFADEGESGSGTLNETTSRNQKEKARTRKEKTKKHVLYQ